MPNPNPQSRDKDHLIGDKININFDKYLWFKKFYNFIILNNNNIIFINKIS